MSEEKKVEGITYVKYKHTFAKPSKEVPEEVAKQIRKESKKVYNKDYYAKHKDNILQYHANLYETKLKVKVVCPLCDRSVSQQYLKKHQKTKLCERFREMKKWVKDNN